MLSKAQIEFYKFAGASALNGTLDNAAAVDKTSTYDLNRFSARLGVVRIPIAAHGIIAGSKDKYPTHIYLDGTTSYEGLRRIVNIPDAGNIDIVAKYVIETFAGTETYKPAVGFNEPWEFVGWEIHADGTPSTSADLIVSKDGIEGTYWNTNYFTEDMQGVTDWAQMWDVPILMSPGTVVYATWANAEGDDWGFEFKVRRLN